MTITTFLRRAGALALAAVLSTPLALLGGAAPDDADAAGDGPRNPPKQRQNAAAADSPEADPADAESDPDPKNPAPADPAADDPAADDPAADDPAAAVPLDATASDAAIEEAVSLLRREYLSRQQDPAATPLRRQSNYFLDNSTKLDPKSLVAALERPVLTDKGARDPHLAAYVKWQLLSGGPETFEGDLLTRVLEVYRKAPVPATRVGMSEYDRKKLDVLLASTKPDGHVRLEDKLDGAVKKTAESNKAALAYRDELYARLPPGYDTFALGLADGYARLSAGAATKDHMKRVVDGLKAWAASGDARPKQCAALAQIVYKLRSERGPKYYVSIGTRGGKPYWVTRTETLYDDDKLRALQEFLEQQATPARPRRGGGGAGAGKP